MHGVISFTFSVTFLVLFNGCNGFSDPPAGSMPDTSGPRSKQIRDLPITISASSEGSPDPFSEEYPWYLSVNSFGQAELSVCSNQTLMSRRTFTVNINQIRELRELLIRNKFFDLEHQYGSQVFDGSRSMVSITIGHMTKSVTFDYLMHYNQEHDHETLSEIARAINVRHSIREWFNDPAAIDLRKTELRALNRQTP